MGNKDYDQLCESFSEVIRAAGKGELLGEEWDYVDGRMARILLCDQLSRAAFRGADEAYAYDDVALNLASEMAVQVLSRYGASPVDWEGEIYGCYAYMCVFTLIHSEAISDHELCQKLLACAKSMWPDLERRWDSLKKADLEHTVVLERFGRYPHRNIQKGRVCTEEEKEWLANKDELPRWAK